jgi:hypothetical protein
MHLVNQTETRKPLLISSRLSLNQDELNAIKSIDNSDETNFQVSKIGKTKPNSYSTPNNNNNNDNQVSKSYKKILNESLGSSQLTSNTKRLNEVDNEVLINSKTDFKRELKYNLVPNDLDLDLLCHNKGLIDVNTSPTKNRTTNKIKKVLCKFVKSNFKSSKR